MDGESTSQRVKRIERDYSLAFKLQVVYEVEKGELTYRQIQKNMRFRANQQSWFG